MRSLARDEAAGPYDVDIEVTDAPVEAIIRRAGEADLVVLGLQRRERGIRSIGELPRAIAQGTDVPLVLISRRPARSLASLSTAQFFTPWSEGS